jgi:phosphomannomutase
MHIPESIFKSYDIRGIYPSEINEENSVPIAKAIYAFFLKKFPDKKSLKVVLGRDMRLSSPAIFEAIKNTLVEAGAEVIVPGIVSTPTFYFTVFHNGFDAGIQITASHNPKDYNGIKFVVNSPNGLLKIGKSTGMEEVKTMAIDGVEVSFEEAGKVIELPDATAEEVDSALKAVGNPEIKGYKIVADAANSVGSLYLDALFKKIPGELIRMNFELDGTFPVHQADPLQPENLKDLQAKVKETGADFGLAPDGDGDRLFFIDERGEIVQPTLITSLVARELLKEQPGSTILFDIRYILTPKRITEENGGKTGITKVGHAFITEKMHETGAVFAGESSAHFFFKATGNAEGPLLVLAYILRIMSETGKKLSELAEEVKRSKESGEINFRVKNAPEILVKLKEKYADGELSELDGVAIEYPTWRFSVRTSNTEPLLRLNVEEELHDVKERGKELEDFIKGVAEFDESAPAH